MKIIILGAGGHAEVVADALLCEAKVGQDIQVVGYLDDDSSLKGKWKKGGIVLGNLAELRTIPYDAVVVGIGNNATRARIFNNLGVAPDRIFTVIHPRAVVSDDVVLGPGTVVFAGAVINTGAVIGSDSIINTGATVDHHAQLGSHVHMAPGSHLGGNVIVGEGVFLGIGSCVIQNISIGAWSTIGAGAAVVRDIPTKVTAVGVPAKIIKTSL